MPGGRLPAAADFPTNLIFAIVPPPSASKPPSNVLVLLHGVGDTNGPFTTLGARLNLPDTVVISLQAPTPMPFELGGFHWGDDIMLDSSSGSMELDAGFQKSNDVLVKQIIRNGLISKCGFTTRQILLFGFGQGGMAALAAAAQFDEELGGVVSVGGILPADARVVASKFKTPILLLGGSSNTAVTDSSEKRVKSFFNNVTIHHFKRPGDSMPGSREEMLPVMQFLASRLRSTAGVPEGSVELT